jgi:hypothetical protein
MRYGAWAVLAAMIAAAGCSTTGEHSATDPTKPKMTHEEAKAAYDELMQKCISRTAGWPTHIKYEAAGMMGISKDEMPPIFCERMFKGIASGRITEADMIKLRKGSATDVYRIIKGG